MARLSSPSGRIDTFVFLVCLILSLTLLFLPTRVQVVVAGRLADVLTAPYHRTRNFISDVGDVSQENARLSARVAELELETATLHRASLDSLRAAASTLLPRFEGSLVPCRVEARKRARFGTMIRVHSLEAAPIRPNLGVISSRGFLGRINALENPRTAWVELLASPDMALGVEIERTGLLAVLRSRAGSFVLDLVARDEDVQPGDRLVTSGIVEVRDQAERIDALGVIPRGLPVGTVTSVAAPSDQIFKEVRVTPLATFARNEIVYIVLPPGRVIPASRREAERP